MARARNRDQVLKTIRKALDADKTKSYVMDVSPLGLVEMTRQNVTDGVREILTKRCPTCDGEGVVESEETVAISVVRRLRDLVDEQAKPEAFLLRVDPYIVSVTGGGRFVGDRRLVRIESVGRAAATASLVGEASGGDGGGGGSDGDSNGDPVESTPSRRRRGRRGGRRRSRAKAQSS